MVATTACRLHGRRRREGLRDVLAEKVVDYATFKGTGRRAVSELAWLYNMNRGIFMTPGREEEWTLSVTHTEEAVDRYVAVFAELAALEGVSGDAKAKSATRGFLEEVPALKPLDSVIAIDLQGSGETLPARDAVDRCHARDRSDARIRVPRCGASSSTR